MPRLLAHCQQRQARLGVMRIIVSILVSNFSYDSFLFITAFIKFSLQVLNLLLDGPRSVESAGINLKRIAAKSTIEMRNSSSTNSHSKSQTAKASSIVSSLRSSTNCPGGSAMVEQCTCSDSSSGSTVTIDCQSLSLDDDQVKTVIDKLVDAMTSVDTFNLQGNALTFIPSRLTSFSELTTINLSKNQITEIKAGDLTLNPAVVSLDLSENSIASIASDALPSKSLIFEIKKRKEKKTWILNESFSFIF